MGLGDIRYAHVMDHQAYPSDDHGSTSQRTMVGLDMSNITTLYKKIKVSTACQLLSCDHTTQQVCKRQVLKEEARKIVIFKPMLIAREVVAADLRAGRKTILKRAKALVMMLDAETRLHHATCASLSKQGQIYHLVPTDATTL